MNHPLRNTLALAILVVFASCTKEKIQTGLEDGKSTVVYDLAGDTLASMGEPAPGSGKEKRPFYLFTFRFSDQHRQFVKNASDSASYLKNTNWDIAFSKEYNAYVVANNGANSGTPGYSGPGSVKMMMVEKAYAQVDAAPDDAAFESNAIPGAGWDPGAGTGWFFYSLTNHLMVPVKNRTYVLKLSNGNFAKLELVNAYKGNPAVVTDLFWPAPYFTFRYFVQTDGSRNLNTH